jgi:hypothetical protein
VEGLRRAHFLAEPHAGADTFQRLPLYHSRFRQWLMPGHNAFRTDEDCDTARREAAQGMRNFPQGNASPLTEGQEMAVLHKNCGARVKTTYGVSAATSDASCDVNS